MSREPASRSPAESRKGSNDSATKAHDDDHSILPYTSDSLPNPSSSPSSSLRPMDRPGIPTRASTTGSYDSDRPDAGRHPSPHSRSEDLNHDHPSSSVLGSGISGSPPKLSQAMSGSGSRPSTPSGSRNISASQSSESSKPILTSTNSSNLAFASCAACGKAMQGPFVRALGTVFHLNCFKCMDCGEVVASKFFPIEGPDGKQQPLCERDYFRRLNLICAKCGAALRGSYITACNKKYHVEHFTCSLCTTLFGPQDSYYEHDGDVYCHFHYSTRFATKCAGCNSAILKQFVEINRNNRDECWHPECYMINKFWNVKVVSRRPSSEAIMEREGGDRVFEEEQTETAITLKEKQARMEQLVYRIWTVLSAFEESSAACISDMLRQVSNGQYLDAIRMAEKFILHVEVLFATIDDLEFHFASLGMKGMSHVREARMLCRKTVELFTLLSHTQETGARRMGMTQELLALVTGLAHYLKILIRIALTGALKLEREHSVRDAMTSFLDKLHLLAVQGGNPSARRLIKGQKGEAITPSPNSNFGTQGVTYGFRSLAPENAGESPFNVSPGSKLSSSHPPSDLCVKCNVTVEEDCVRLGTYQRWHSTCVQCVQCGKIAAVPIAKEPPPPKNQSGEDKDGSSKEQAPKLSTARRPPANVGLFVYEIESMKETPSFGEVPTVIMCTDHAHAGCRGGFLPVQRLEQYAFLLNVALRRLYLLLKKQGVVPLSPVPASTDLLDSSRRDSYSSDIRKSVHLDRKLSAAGQLPKRSTIVESPSGRSVAPTSTEVHGSRSPPQVHQVPAVAGSNQQIPPSSQQEHVLRPAFARNNTEVMIVDDTPPPASPGEERPPMQTLEEGITLADLPQLMEAAQAREQRRSLPRESAIPYIAELGTLELAIVKYSAVLVLMRSPLKEHIDLDEILEMVEVKKPGFWKTLFNRNDKKNVKKKGVFGVPLELLVEREGADSLLGASGATLRVPSFIDDVISAMRQMDLSVEGIFRKNGNIRRLKELTEAIDRDPASVDLTQDFPVQLAALLKKYLRDLPDPLLTFKLHRLLIASQSLPQESDRKRMLHMLSIILPKSHRDTMEVLFVFLKWVASFAHLDEETGSKMDLGNLATVICPSILYSRNRDPARDESFGAIRVVTALLENQDEFWVVPEEFLPIVHDQEYFANSLELPGKEFLKKCETYHKVKGGANGPRPTFGGINGNSSSHYNNYPMSPVSERPPGLPQQGVEQRGRQGPGPGTPMGNNTYMGNPSATMSPRIPSDEQWPPGAGSSRSRPSSVQGRGSFDQSGAGPSTPNLNGYLGRQRQ